MKKGIDCIGNFLDNVQRAVKFTIHQKLVGHLGLMGLSRGGLVASLLAAREERFKAMVQFAPVTKIVHTKEFQHMESNPLVQSLDPFALADRLANRPSRFYVGNRDARVGTKNCVEFAMLLAERSTLRSPPIELIVSPSIGSQGHGTSPEIFRQGAEWLADCLQ
jgi:esterase FrsA